MAILISHNIRIVCDKCGAEHHSDETTVGAVRREAMELGWGQQPQQRHLRKVSPTQTEGLDR